MSSPKTGRTIMRLAGSDKRAASARTIRQIVPQPRHAMNADMFERKPAAPIAPLFTDLPAETITCGSAGSRIAVHVHGTLRKGCVPIVCVPGYLRNMSDFAALPAAINRLPETGFTLLLVDLPGRGRSTANPAKQIYSSLRDADCVCQMLTALDIPRAIFLGEGHGGQVAMIAAFKWPGLVAGAVLIDAGPVTDPRGLVRSRNNYNHLAGLRGTDAIKAALRKILAADYPGENEARLDRLAERLYAVDGKGRLYTRFDSALIRQLEDFDFDDAFEPQWPLFDCLAYTPLMLIRTQLSDQLRRATFEEMVRKRPDAALLTISGQGSPALLDSTEEHQALAAFFRQAGASREDGHSLPAEVSILA